MGHDQSKEEQVKQIGDQQVTVIENQEVHTEALEQSGVKITIILIIVALQLVLAIMKHIKKKFQKSAVQAARTIVLEQSP